MCVYVNQLTYFLGEALMYSPHGSAGNVPPACCERPRSPKRPGSMCGRPAPALDEGYGAAFPAAKHHGYPLHSQTWQWKIPELNGGFT